VWYIVQGVQKSGYIAAAGVTDLRNHEKKMEKKNCLVFPPIERTKDQLIGFMLRNKYNCEFFLKMIGATGLTKKRARFNFDLCLVCQSWGPQDHPS
jgi:hypothetical protein